MKNNLIIGAGQLGSRHLQGLLKWKGFQTIFVVDPSDDSLDIAKTRASEIEHTHNIIFSSGWDELPQTLDFVIVATSANVRKEILLYLLNNYRVSSLLLEKVLFQSIDDYHLIQNLIEKKGVKVWVNHPRRLFDHYKKLKKTLENNRSQTIFSVIGIDWGLGCNALHYIDIFSFLSNSYVASIDVDWLNPRILPSKRKGFIEFTGVLKGTLETGDHFIIGSLEGSPSPITVNITNNIGRWMIQEGNTSQLVDLNDGDSIKSVILNAPFQSDLTTGIADSIFQLQEPALPTYVEAARNHIPFIESLLEKFNRINNTSSNYLPIT